MPRQLHSVICQLQTAQITLTQTPSHLLLSTRSFVVPTRNATDRTPIDFPMLRWDKPSAHKQMPTAVTQIAHTALDFTIHYTS
jgi:hypothetical protein